MSAEILSLDPRVPASLNRPPVPDQFRKALAAISALAPLCASDAGHAMTQWRNTGKLTESEFEALREFYGWDGKL